MNYDYNFGNKYFNYYGKKGVESIVYDIIAPEQEQKRQPGFEYVMKPLPIFDDENYKGSGRLKDKVAIITGGDSGLGKTCAIYFVKEGAKVVICYLDEDKDAYDTKCYIESLGGVCHLIKGDITNKEFCKSIVDETLNVFGKIDILVNNAGVQYQ